MTGSGEPPRVLCTGRFYCDVIFTGLRKMPTPGEEVFASGLSLKPGGGAFITAAYLAALGRPAALASPLFPGPFLKSIETELTQSGVDMSCCRSAPAMQEPQITVAIANGAERAFLTRRTGPAVPADIAETIAGGGFTHLHIGELSALVEQPALVPLARKAGLSISLDCSWDEDVLARDDLDDLIASVDIFLPNAAEAARLGNLSGQSPIAPLTVIKRGPDGARAITDDGSVDVGTESVNVVDPTGAGDAFNAGFLDAWLADLPLRHCLAAGNACGAEAVTRVGGATDLPDMRNRSAMPNKHHAQTDDQAAQ